MSILVLFITVAAFVMIFSEFGGKIRASSALGWWAIAIFLILAILQPTLLKPISSILGITLVSNFVLSAAVVFLVLQVFSLSAQHTAESRKLRTIISKGAAETFIAKKQIQPKKNQTKVLIVLPCYNEEGSIPQLIPQLNTLIQTSKHNIDYCFVDDGSTDSSRKILGDLSPDHFTTHIVNNNVSGVLLTGFYIATLGNFDYVIQCDGDGQHPIAEIERLIDETLTTRSDLLIGSRFTKASNRANNLESTTLLRRSGSLVLIATLRLLWPSLRCTDPTSGFRVYSKRLAQFLQTHMPDEFPEPESIALTKVAKLNLNETQVEMLKRNTGISSITGLRSAIYMYKAISALIGLRLRSFWKRTKTH